MRSGRLEAFAARPGDAVVLTDFDGTLAPIVADPSQAVALEGTAPVLVGLARRYHTVGVISGRPVAYLARRLGAAADHLTLCGLYGLERLVGGVATEDAAAGAWRATLAAAATRAEEAAPSGVTIERKGLAVTLHTRNAEDGQPWLDDMTTVAEAVGLEAHPGRRSVELRPPVPTDKGTVVRDLGAGHSAVCFLGDDRGDLPAFAALAELARRGATTVAIAVASDEAPPELLAAADLVVDGPPAALGLLAELLDLAG